MDERKEWNEKKEQLERVRNAFQNPDLRGWIPNYLITVLEEDNDTEEILLKMEQVMPQYCVSRKFATEESQSLNEGSERQDDWRCLLFELSPTIREFWAEQYKNYINPNGRYQTLLGFADMHEKYMGVSHESSIGLLYSAGWKPVDTMCAYLLSMTTKRMYSLSPDAVREAVRLDGEAAVRLLDKKVLGEAIVHHHSSYQVWWQKIWMEFLYLFCDFQNQEFLHLEGTGIRTRNHHNEKGSLLPVPAFSVVGACAGKPGLCPGGTAAPVRVHGTGGFPGNHREREGGRINRKVPLGLGRKL